MTTLRCFRPWTVYPTACFTVLCLFKAAGLGGKAVSLELREDPSTLWPPTPKRRKVAA